MSEQWRNAAEVFAVNVADHFDKVEFDTLIDIFMAGANHASAAYEEEITRYSEQSKKYLDAVNKFKSEIVRLEEENERLGAEWVRTLWEMSKLKAGK